MQTTADNPAGRQTAPVTPADDEPDQPPGPTTPGGVRIHDETGSLPTEALGWLTDRAHRAARLAAGDSHDIRVRIVGDDAMTSLHKRFMGVDATTDVLTFDARESADEPLDADVVVCLDEAARQAAQRGGGAERELLLYILHAVLHCAGHDDHDEAAAAAMHAREDEILTAIGVGPVYAEPRRRGDGQR